MPAEALRLLNSLEKATTIIYDHKQGLAKNMIAADNTIAVRIPNHEFCKELIGQFGKPIVSTSANKSGESTPQSFVEIDDAMIEKMRQTGEKIGNAFQIKDDLFDYGLGGKIGKPTGIDIREKKPTFHSFTPSTIAKMVLAKGC